MQELLIVNPSRRPSKRRKSTKAASPAQKRARAAFAAMARGRAKNPRKRKSAKRRSRPSTALTIMANPRKRRSSVAKRVHHRRRRNPISIGLSKNKIMGILTPALIGALGATAVNTILARLPIPAVAMTGKARYLTQAAAAIGLSMIASKMGVKGSTATQLAEGSLTVTLHQAITDVAQSAGMNLSGMGYYLPGVGVRGAIPSRASNSAPMALRGMQSYVTGPGSPRAMQMNGMPRQSRTKSGFGF